MTLPEAGTSLPNDRYPRVLISYLSCINAADQHALSLRNWFGDWPRERLAQIYSGNERGEERFCSHTFRLGPTERRLGGLFFRLKGSALGEAASPLLLDQTAVATTTRQANRKRLLRRLSKLLLESGVWEIAFSPVISPELREWIHAFRPDVIYCQSYTLTFAWLPVMIQREFDLPICFHVVDDWPAFVYKRSFAAPVVRPLVRKAAEKVVRSAGARFAIGPGMTMEYEKRYGVEFESLMQCDSLARFEACPPQRAADPGTTSIVYTGSLELGRWKALIDLATSAEALTGEGQSVIITAFASAVPPEALGAFAQHPILHVVPPPSHGNVPSVLKGADILFLPESFDPEFAVTTALAISTKAHLYMMSQRPVLVYAPTSSGITQYARTEGWAHVVDRRDNASLTLALRQLVSNQELTERLVARAREVVSGNHDEVTVREHLRRTLSSLAARGAA